MQRFEVIESRHWRAADGRTASLFGAVPWRSDAEKAADGWEVANRGFTIRDNQTGTVGTGRQPYATRAEAQAAADAWAARLGVPA